MTGKRQTRSGRAKQLGAELALFKKHPDLWAVSKVLKYCKGSSWGQTRQSLWDSLTDEQRGILEGVSRGAAP